MSKRRRGRRRRQQRGEGCEVGDGRAPKQMENDDDATGSGAVGAVKRELSLLLRHQPSAPRPSKPCGGTHHAFSSSRQLLLGWWCRVGAGTGAGAGAGAGVGATESGRTRANYQGGRITDNKSRRRARQQNRPRDLERSLVAGISIRRGGMRTWSRREVALSRMPNAGGIGYGWGGHKLTQDATARALGASQPACLSQRAG